MRLKQIKLAGFKSFAQPTTLVFPSNRVAIVGPNGCGKSNILDAIRWVLGERGSKSLRAGHMADVIFNGSTKRGPASRASVELVLETENAAPPVHSAPDPTIPSAALLASCAQIAIRREITRDGQSHYFLNGTRCRRADIVDVFLGTGLGGQQYAIIEQGMISRLAESQPEQLRGFLEEAAGVSRYQEKKKETESHLQQTADNLLRLQDLWKIQQEHTRHLGEQAEKTRQYRDVQAQHREAQLMSALCRDRDLEQMEGRAARQSEKVGQAEREAARLLEIVQRKYEQGNAERSAQYALWQRIQGAYTRATQVEQAALSQCRSLEQRGHDLRQKIEEGSQEQRDLESEYAALLRQTEQDRQELGLQAAALEGLQAAVHAKEQEVKSAQQHTLRAQEKWRAQTALLDAAKRACANAQWEWDNLTKEGAALQSQQQAWLAKQQEAEREQTRHATDGFQGEEARAHTHWLQAQQHTEQLLRAKEEARTIWQRQAESLQEAQQGLAHTDALLQTYADLQQERAHALCAPEALRAWHDQRGLPYCTWSGEGLPPMGEAPPIGETVVERLLGPWLHGTLLSESDWDRIWAQLANGDTEAALPEAPSADVICLRADLWQTQPNLPNSLHCLHMYPVSGMDEARLQLAELPPGAVCVTPQGVCVSHAWLRIPAAQTEETGYLRLQRLLDEKKQEQAVCSERCAAALRACTDAQTVFAETEEQWKCAKQLEESCYQVWIQAREAAAKVRAMQEWACAQYQLCTQELSQLALRKAELDAVMLTKQEEQRQLQAVESAAQLHHAQAQADWESHEAVEKKLQAVWGAEEQAYRTAHWAYQEKKLALQSSDHTLQRITERLQGLSQTIAQWQQRSTVIESELQQASLVHAQMHAELQAVQEQLQEHEHRVHAMQEAQAQHQQAREQAETALEACRAATLKACLAVERARAERDAWRVQWSEESLEAMAERWESSLQPVYPDRRTWTAKDWQQLANELDHAIRQAGSINWAAPEEWEQALLREQEAQAQCEDLEQAMGLLRQSMESIEQHLRESFLGVFQQVDRVFREVFQKIFPGGEAYLRLEGEDPLSAGVVMMARPPGKKNCTIGLLSGGEKALTALAFLFAIFSVHPSPFCVLDEVDAPLDEANLRYFSRLLEEISREVPLIWITHHTPTMETATHLIGITMQEPGVSQAVSVALGERQEQVQETV